MQRRPYLKALIADVIFEKLAVANWSRIRNAVEGIEEVRTFYESGELHGLVKVITSEGSRYYEVTMKEKR